MAWAPPLAPDKIPKIVLRRIKYPDRVKALVRVTSSPGGGLPNATHYVAVVRNRVVALDHTPAGDVAAAVLVGDYVCRCHRVKQLWATWTLAELPRKLKDRKFVLPESPDDLPPDLHHLRHNCCRVPAGTHRSGFLSGRRSRYRTHPTATTPHDDPQHPAPRKLPDNLAGRLRESRAAERLIAEYAADLLDAGDMRPDPAHIVVDPHRRDDILDVAVHPGPGAGQRQLAVSMNAWTWVARVRARGVPPAVPAVYPDGTPVGAACVAHAYWYAPDLAYVEAVLGRVVACWVRGVPVVPETGTTGSAAVRPVAPAAIVRGILRRDPGGGWRLFVYQGGGPHLVASQHVKV